MFSSEEFQIQTPSIFNYFQPQFFLGFVSEFTVIKTIFSHQGVSSIFAETWLAPTTQFQKIVVTTPQTQSASHYAMLTCNFFRTFFGPVLRNPYDF